MAENMNNAPIRVDDDPFVGCINQEYRNSADVVGKPVLPAAGTDKRKYYDDAIEAERASVTHVGVYGAADYELDEDGNKVAVERMGDKPDTTAPAEPAADEPADDAVPPLTP